MFSMVIVEISAESVKACSFHRRKSIPDTEIIRNLGWIRNKRDITSSSTRQLLQNNMRLTIYLEGGYVTFFRRRIFFFKRHKNHIFLFADLVGFIHIEHTCTFFSTTIDGRNLVFGHKLHIGTPYHGKWQGYHT
jgi:hypothetical protein